MRKVIAFASLLLWGLFGSPAPRALAQTPTLQNLPATRADSPRAALQKGIEFVLRGEPEAAEPFLRQAETGRGQLSPTEQSRLDDYLHNNQEALTARRQVADQLQKARDAVRLGKRQDAEQLLATLRGNKNLTARERLEVELLNDQAKPASTAAQLNGTVGKSPDFGSMPRLSADALLGQSRQALQRGDFDKAEALALESEQAGYRSILPWSDSPAKVRNEIEAARSRSGTVADGARKNGPNLTTLGNSREMQARLLLKQAQQAIAIGDHASGRVFIREAEELGVSLPTSDVLHPQNLRSELVKAEQKNQPIKTASHTPETGLVTLAPVGGETLSSVVKEARARASEGRLDEAEALARKAQQLPGVRWSLTEDTPEKVLVDVARLRGSLQQEKAARLLLEARQKLQQNQFEEAESLIARAERTYSKYPLWYIGDTPDRLRAESEQRQRTQAFAQLPPLLDTGDQPRKPLLPPKEAIAARTPAPTMEGRVIVPKAPSNTTELPAPTASLAVSSSPVPSNSVAAPPPLYLPPPQAPAERGEPSRFAPPIGQRQGSTSTPPPPPLALPLTPAVAEPAQSPPVSDSGTGTFQPLPSLRRQTVVPAMATGSPHGGANPTRQVLATSRDVPPSELIRQKALKELAQAKQFQRQEMFGQIDEPEYRRNSQSAEKYYELGVQAFLHKDYRGTFRYLENLDTRLLEERKRGHAREIMNTCVMHLPKKKAAHHEELPQ